MQLKFTLRNGLPKLAWLASVEPNRQITTVNHGPWVEVFETGFIEGIWDGPFVEPVFDCSACVFGSGALIRGQSIIFVPSTSTTDYLYWWSRPDKGLVEVSNSLPLLLANLGDELDPQVGEYPLINNSIMFGINRYVRRIPTRRGAVQRLMHLNLKVSPGVVVEEDKPRPPAFNSFEEYSTYLTTCYGRLVKNAKDLSRSRPMAIFSTQSRGYDTTAANAVAKDHGIDIAFTVTKGKAKGYFGDEDRQIEADDDGIDICRLFGLPCIPIDRRAVERETGMEYLFYASMHETGDFNLQEISAHVARPTVLITGCLGEIWYPKSYYESRPGLINSDLMRVDLGNHGLTEVRLEGGYVQLAFPYLGARSRSSIFHITESEEMDPWRLGREYDRPIPRRLAEQAGVPRSMFGQIKMASVLEFPPPIVPVGDRLREEFLASLVDHKLLAGWQCILVPLARRWNSIVLTTTPSRHVWNYYAQRAVTRVLRRPFSFPLALGRLNGAIFCFCVNRRVKDYHRGLQ